MLIVGDLMIKVAYVLVAICPRITGDFLIKIYSSTSLSCLGLGG